MSHPILGSNYFYHEDYGGFVNGNHERIARILHEYDPELELGWVPPDKRDPGEEKPFCVIHNHPNGSRQAVSFWREDEIDERILEWAFENDFRKHSPDAIFNRMEARNLAAKLKRQKEIEDETAEKWEFGKSLLKSPLHTYRHGGKVFRG